MQSLTSICSILALVLATVDANCYFTNGTDRNTYEHPSDRYSPCDTKSPSASMCCSSKYGGDACVPVGSLAASLCWNQQSNVLWREACTDRSWTSTNCVKLFMNDSTIDITVTNCSASGFGEGFCYGHQNFGCCKTGMAVFIDPKTGGQVETNPASSTTTSSQTPVVTSTSSASASSIPVNATGESLSVPAKVGIGVSVGVAAIGVAFAIVFLCARRRRKRQRAEQSELAKEKLETRQYWDASELQSKHRGTELPTVERYELWKSDRRAELTADEYQQSLNFGPPVELPLSEHQDFMGSRSPLKQPHTAELHG